MEGRNKTGVFGIAEYESRKCGKTTRWRKSTNFWHSSSYHCVVLREGGPSDFMLVCGFETNCMQCILSCTSFVDVEQYREKTLKFFSTAQKKEQWSKKFCSSLEYKRNKFLDTEITDYTHILHTFHLRSFKTGLI